MRGVLPFGQVNLRFLSDGDVKVTVSGVTGRAQGMGLGIWHR